MSKITTSDHNKPEMGIQIGIFCYHLHNDADRLPQLNIKGTPGRLWHLMMDAHHDSHVAMTGHVKELKANGFFDAELRAFGRLSITTQQFKDAYLPLHTFAMQPRAGSNDEQPGEPELNDEGYITPFGGANPYPGDIELSDPTPFTPEEAASWKAPTIAEVFMGRDDGIRFFPRPPFEAKTLVGKYFKTGTEAEKNLRKHQDAWGPFDSDPDQAEAQRMVGEFFETLAEGHGKTPYQLVIDYHRWLKTRTRAKRLDERYGRDTRHSMRMGAHPAGRGLPGSSGHMQRGTYSYDTATHHYEIRQDTITGEPLEAKAYSTFPDGSLGVDDIESRRTLSRLVKSWEALGGPHVDKPE